MGEIKFVGGLLMASLFAIAIFSFAIGFGNDNDAPINIINDTNIMDSNYTIATYTESFVLGDINDSSTSFAESTISSGDEVMEGGGQFKVGFSTLVLIIGSIFTLTKEKIFGGSDSFGLILTSLTGFLVFVGIRYIYKSWVGRNPD